jgi:uncharacterized Zn-binding protein involved in type VI secretion
MFVKRYHITEGASTTAGGVVRASTKCGSINSASMVLDGDPVDCPACGAQGVIKCVMPRLPQSFEGKQYALSDDLCMCGCNPPPKLIANQNFMSQGLLCIDGDPPGKATSGRSENGAKAATPPVESARQVDLRPLRFLIRGTHRPYASHPYRLTLADGKVVQGTSDANGATNPLTADESAALRTLKRGER